MGAAIDDDQQFDDDDHATKRATGGYQQRQQRTVHESPAHIGITALPLRTSYKPAEAIAASAIPLGAGWQFEPKWDGFRCLGFRDGANVDLRSKSGKPLTRYFPEIVAALRSLSPAHFVLDGELIVLADGAPDFDELLQRIHPAATRVRMLAETRPALYIVFDLLAESPTHRLTDEPLSLRRRRLERFAARWLRKGTRVRLSPATRSRATVRRWFARTGGALDGIVAKPLSLPYRSGERDGAVKVKHERTADCVVGGFRYASKGKLVGSLLLGLYDRAGRLHHVGFVSGIREDEKRELTARLKRLIKPPGFTGAAPGGPSRWSTERSEQWEPLAPKLVVEVAFDHVTNSRFRHGARLVRWRPDKAPRQCTLSQLRTAGGSERLIPR